MPSLAIGTTTTIPPTPTSFRANHIFKRILSTVLVKYAHTDPDVKSTAAANTGKPAGWIHVSDTRAPAAFGRIPDPQDIFGSLVATSEGKIQGSLMESGTYRLVTNDGM